MVTMKKPRQIASPSAHENHIKRCWIHIGMHKTDCSSIQTSLSGVKRPQGWCYLKVGSSAKMGTSLQAMFGSNAENFHFYSKRGVTAEELAKKRELLRRQLELIIRNTEAQNLILSAETLSAMAPADIQALRDFLLPLVDEIRVIGYVRPHDGFRISMFEHLVKLGKADFNIDKVKPGYRKRFAKFDRIFGRKNVKLRLFDTSEFANGCIVADFCTQTGIKPLKPEQVTHLNESLTREACGMLYAYRKFGPGYGLGKTVLIENKQLIEPMQAMKGTGFHLADSLLAPGRVNAAKDIEWMEKRLKCSLEEPWKSDDSEVSSEEELLQIRRSSCAEYLEKFTEIHGIEVPDDILPAGDSIKPVEVADMLEHCRELLRRRMEADLSLKNDRTTEKLGDKPFKRCWIHVGMHKTGSTSIQANLGRHKHPVGWRYLKMSGSVILGQSLYAMFGNNPQDFHMYAKRGLTPEQLAKKRGLLLRQFERMIRKSKEETLILSSELLSVMDKSEIQTLRDFLAPLVDDIRVVAYVRSSPGFRTSWFQQLVKHGRGHFNIKKIRPNYRKRLEKFDEVFGRKNVKLCLFNPAALAKGCIVTDFCGQIGITPPAPEQITRANESLTKEACGILYAYRKFGSGFGVGDKVLSENRWLIQPMFTMTGVKFRLSDSLLAPGSSKDAKDLAWMENRLGISLKEEWQMNGTEVASEEELLQISRSSCAEYLEKFTEIHDIKIPDDILPTGDPIHPVEVADMIERCRDLIRAQMNHSPQAVIYRIKRYVKRKRRQVTSLIDISPQIPGKDDAVSSAGISGRKP